MSVPLRCQRKDVAPSAATVNVTGSPTVTVWLAGCRVKRGTLLPVKVILETVPIPDVGLPVAWLRAR
jgi:hypothetical protein